MVGKSGWSCFGNEAVRWIVGEFLDRGFYLLFGMVNQSLVLKIEIR
jgi:hypothetical protein